MKTIKVIDLLNMISKGEEVPEKFTFGGLVFERKGSYIEDEDGDSIFDSMLTDFSNINDEIEIIEEKKLPEKIDVKGSYNSNKGFEDFTDNEQILVYKINEIIDYLESKEKGE